MAVLVAGMRAHLAYAQAGILEASTPIVVRAATLPRPAPLSPPQYPGAGCSDCDQLKQLIDAHVPLVSGQIAIQGKQFVKDAVKGFVDGLFGKGTDLARAVGPAFSALGLLFRVAALVMLYEHAVVKLRIEPGFIHKPIGSPELAAAIVDAGIPDSEWEAAKQNRRDNFWVTALRTCAGFLGLPVTEDLINVGENVKSWVVQWEITEGLGRHARLHEGELSGPGAVAMRIERPLQQANDHAGTDTLAIDVLTETESDHPGTEYTDIVRVCARVVPRAPPDGFKAFLKAGMAGSSLATSASPISAIFKMASLIGDILMGLYREMSTIDACENMNVSYHVAQPMPWRGRITVNWESHSNSVQSREISTGWGTGPHG